jgi:hypothetical protein
MYLLIFSITVCLKYKTNVSTYKEAAEKLRRIHRIVLENMEHYFPRNFH